MPKWAAASTNDVISLYKFSGMFPLADYAGPDWISRNPDKVRKGIALDIETTGLDPRRHKVIEIGIRPFAFNKDTGELLSVGELYSALQDPGEPISKTVHLLTGLTDTDLSNRTIDWNEVDRLICDAHIVISHHAAFDRSFVEKHLSASIDKVWGCSLKQIDWLGKGFRSNKLENLVYYHGFYTDFHRASGDVEALLLLLGSRGSIADSPYLLELLNNARKPSVRVVATGAPFEAKDRLKDRGYDFCGLRKTWWKVLQTADESLETAWLEENIYSGKTRATTTRIRPSDMFKPLPDSQ